MLNSLLTHCSDSIRIDCDFSRGFEGFGERVQKTTVTRRYYSYCYSTGARSRWRNRVRTGRCRFASGLHRRSPGLEATENEEDHGETT